MTVPVEEQIAAVERCLEDFRWARSKPHLIEYRTYRALKAVAKDLRAQMPGASNETLLALQRRIADAAGTKGTDALGFSPPALAGIGQEVIGRWPVIRQALERFEKRNDATESP